MATKFELAQYLVNIHTLMQAQTASVHSIPSTTLADDYNRTWDILKDTITKENEDETRNRNNDPKRDKAGTDSASD